MANSFLDKATVQLTWKHVASAIFAIFFASLLITWRASEVVADITSSVDHASERVDEQFTAVRRDIVALKQSDDELQSIASDVGVLTERTRANSESLDRIESRIDALFNERRGQSSQR